MEARRWLRVFAPEGDAIEGTAAPRLYFRDLVDDRLGILVGNAPSHEEEQDLLAIESVDNPPFTRKRESVDFGGHGATSLAKAPTVSQHEIWS
jgi:hypothetical protein